MLAITVTQYKIVLLNNVFYFMMRITADDHTPNAIPELNSQPTKYIRVS